jgi:hypothetical protein
MPIRRLVLASLLAVAVGAAAFAGAVHLGLLQGLPFLEYCQGMGAHYQEMSADPFALRGDHPHRILGPMLAYLLGLGGADYWRFSHGTLVVMLATVFAAARHLGARMVDAALVTLALACSGGVLLYTSLLVGFSDPLICALLLATLMAARRGPWCWLVHLLNLFNHDLALFFTPFLLYLRWQARPRWGREVIWLGAVFAVYAAFRLWVNAHAPDLRLSVDFYVKTSHFPRGTIGLAALTTADSVHLFGPLLVVMFWAAWQPARKWENRALMLFVATVYAFLVVAYDFSRFTGYLFLPVGAAAVRFLHGGRNRIWFAMLAAAAARSFIVLTRDVVPEIGLAMARCNALNDPRQFSCVALETAGILVSFATALVVMAAASFWLARVLPARDRAED